MLLFLLYWPANASAQESEAHPRPALEIGDEQSSLQEAEAARFLELQLSLGLAESVRLRLAYFPLDWLSVQLSSGTFLLSSETLKLGLGLHKLLGQVEFFGLWAAGETFRWLKDNRESGYCQSYAEELKCGLPDSLHVLVFEFGYLYHFQGWLWGLSGALEHRFGYDPKKYDHLYVVAPYFVSVNCIFAWDF